MTLRPCARLAEDRSALVDGALDGPRREQLLAHLVRCEGCRADVVELRRIRAALRRPPVRHTPSDLEQRLVAIAGADAAAPLWSRPFRRTRAGALSSRRRARRVRAAAAVLVVGTVVTAVAVTGYVAAPPASVAAVADPGPEAVATFGDALSQFPLADNALQAVLAADLPAGAPGGAPAAPAEGLRALPADAARTALQRAAAAADTVAHTGVESVRSRSGDQTLQASVRVDAIPGQGVRTTVLGASGRQVGQSFTPTATTARMVDDRLLGLLDDHYALQAWSGARAAGRPATLVQASQGGRRAARWWVDDASGLVLARQTFDDQARELAAAVFTSVQLDPAAPMFEHLPARLVVPTTGTALTLSSADDLAQQGWVCPRELAGLTLVRLRSDRDPAADVVNLVYSDGLRTVSVLEQRGVLAAPPRGASWDTALQAYTEQGPSGLATWQSGGTVLTVVSDGPPALIAAAVSALPHEPVPGRTTMGRIREGWRKLLADTKG